MPGRIRFDGHDITHLPVHQRIRLGLSRSFQILSVFRNLTAFENVRVAAQARSAQRHALWRDAYGLADVNGRTWSLLAAVGLEDRAAEPCANLSHGERRLLEIAIALATDARLLLLDEPLAGLAEADRAVVGALIRQLASTHAVLLIEHDIDRVLALSDRITVLHQGRLIADGKPAEVANNPEVITAYLGAARGAIAPAAAAAGAVAAGAARELLRLEGVRGGYGGSVVLDGLDLVVHEGEAVALLGRNGVGKTTTLRAITGTVAKSAGRISIGGTDITAAKPYEINRLGRFAGAGGAAAVPQPDRGGEFAHRRAAGWRLVRRCLRAVPEAAPAAALVGREPVGRRAADAGDRAGADGAGAGDPAGRAVRGAGADGRGGGDGRAGAAARARRDGDRGAPRRDGAADHRPGLCAGERAGGVPRAARGRWRRTRRCRRGCWAWCTRRWRRRRRGRSGAPP